MARLAAGLAVFITLFACAFAQAAERRVALVIGNGAYTHSPELVNPANDAQLLSASLSRIGFDVVRAVDASRRDLLDAVGEFGRKAENADIALFFYAGHGLEVGGRNWILPVDAEVEASTDLPVAAVKVDDVLEVMELSGARVRLVFLDACRNNPLPRSLSRAVGRGLARIDVSAAGTMIAFAAAPGTVALDGTGANSPFSTALAKHILEPGLDVRQMMGKVRADVMTETGEKQVPWVNEALIGNTFLAGEADDDTPRAEPQQPPAVSSGRSDTVAIELEFWNSVKDSGQRELLELYLANYPQGAFRELAQVKIAMLEKPVSGRTVDTPRAGEDMAAMEARARQFVADFNITFSSPADIALARMSDIYANQVDFYGKPFSYDEIMRDKASLMQRWPERNYFAPEQEMNVFCNPAGQSCSVTARIYWSVSSAARGKSASGISRTDLRLDFSGGGPRVVFENGETVSRN
ncbi:MAG: caspase domain-containing protein [Pseudomonadota bacterium]|nr:caspase domain-containing protein [Pseudomonadota bacterium]